MKLSIIIPTFNSASVLGRALDSIVSQIFVDWEVLVMDGGSKDNTIQIANAYHDNRIRTFSELDKGIYDAMNKGIKKSQGEWLYFLGSDDYLLNPYVLAEVFSQSIDKYDVVYGEVESDYLSPFNKGEWDMSIIGYNRCHQAIFYKKILFNRLGNYNLKYRVAADFDLNLKWFLSENYLNKYININIAHYSEGGFSEKTNDEMFSNDFYYLVYKRAYKKLTLNQRITYAKLVQLHSHLCIRKLFISLQLNINRAKRKVSYFLGLRKALI